MGATCLFFFFFFPKPHLYKTSSCSCSSWRGSSDVQTLRSYIYALWKDTIGERSFLKGFSYIPITVFTHFDHLCVTLNSKYHESPVLLSDFWYDAASEPPAAVQLLLICAFYFERKHWKIKVPTFHVSPNLNLWQLFTLMLTSQHLKAP